MTIFLPLEADSPHPSKPSFLVRSSDVTMQLQKVIQSILKARRIVVVCGAGISVSAGVPDFRSPEGIFQLLRRGHPTGGLVSGKDLFYASVFSAKHTTALFCQMIADLYRLSQAAEPTPFHHILRALNDHGKLLRIYTQNVDTIEQKTGLSFGVRTLRNAPGSNLENIMSQPGVKRRGFLKNADNDAVSIDHVTEPFPTSTSAPTDQEVPRCIPLHGSVQWMHCTLCTSSFPLQDHIDTLSSGKLPTCPMCTATELGRQRMGLRQWGMGKLRPSVVLYNEAHHNGDEVGETVYRDLMGFKGRGGADLLLVAGTSLKVPGTKRIVKEFSKSVRQGAPSRTKDRNIDCSPERAVRSQTSCRSESWQSSCSDPAPEAPMKVLYLNLDFPMPMREWQGVFDIWVQGDVQQFARLLQDEIDQQAKANQSFVPRKRKREAEHELAL